VNYNLLYLLPTLHIANKYEKEIIVFIRWKNSTETVIHFAKFIFEMFFVYHQIISYRVYFRKWMILVVSQLTKGFNSKLDDSGGNNM